MSNLEPTPEININIARPEVFMALGQYAVEILEMQHQGIHDPTKITKQHIQAEAEQQLIEMLYEKDGRLVAKDALDQILTNNPMPISPDVGFDAWNSFSKRVNNLLD